jgi:hypothetical protein
VRCPFGGAAPGGGRGGNQNQNQNQNQGQRATVVGGAGQQARATVNRDGTFQIANVIPGAYYLFASGRVTNAQVSAYQRLDIGAGEKIVFSSGRSRVYSDFRSRFSMQLPFMRYCSARSAAQHTPDRPFEKTIVRQEA